MVPTRRPWGAVSSGGTSMDRHSELSPHKNLVISAKVGGGFCFCVMGLPTGVFAPGWKWLMNLLWGWHWWALSAPYCGSPEKNPACRPFCSYCGLLCSHVASGYVGLEGLDEVIFTQCNGTSLVRTSSSVNDISGSMDSLNSCMHTANWPGWLGRGSWAFSA